MRYLLLALALACAALADAKPDRRSLAPQQEFLLSESLMGKWKLTTQGVVIDVVGMNDGSIRINDQGQGWGASASIERGVLWVRFDVPARNCRYVGKYWLERGELVGWYSFVSNLDEKGESNHPVREVWRRVR